LQQIIRTEKLMVRLLHELGKIFRLLITIPVFMV
jgi:hypothetical protein